VRNRASRGPLPESMGDVGEWVSVRRAADVLRLSDDAVRRRIHKGQLRARRLETPQGYHFEVWVTDAVLAEEQVDSTTSPVLVREKTPPGHDSAAPEPIPVASNGAVPEAQSDSPGAVRTAPGEVAHEASPPRSDDAGWTLQATRARELAEYTERLLAPWRLRLEEHVEEIGRLKAELRHAQSQTSGQETMAEEMGRLKAELEQARQQVTAFEATTDELERERAAAAAEPRHPWWRFW
jgi:hypothetical protein